MKSASSRTLARVLRVPAAAALCAITAIGCGEKATDALSPADAANSTTVNPYIITSTPATVPSLAVGQTYQITTRVTMMDGVTVVHPILTWASSDSTVAIVSSTGLVTAKAGGTARITASARNTSGITDVTVPSTIASIAITPASITNLAVGATSPLSATAKNASGTVVTAPITWTSSDTTVAKVTAGVVTGIKIGSATITAASGGKSATAPVSVVASATAVASVSLTPTSISNLAVGATSTLTASAKNAAGAAVTATLAVWTSSDTTVAKVAAAGVVTGIKAGTATITAASGGKTANAPVTVVAAAPTVASVAITPNSISNLAIGATSTLTAVAKDASGATVSGATITWTSSDTTVAKVAAGVVTGIKAGSANIIAAAGGKSATAPVTVAASTTTPPVTPPPAPGTEVRATLPQVYINTTMPAAPAAGGKIITVAAGGSLQSALTSALPGDVIELAAGATFTGNFSLPAKTGTGWIVIRPSNYAQLPAAGARMTPTIAQQLNLPKILATGQSPALSAGNGSHHWRIVGIEVSVASTVTQNYGLVSIDAPSATAVSQLPHDITLDRMYIHGTSTVTLRRCIALNSVMSAVIDSHVSDCHEPSQDSQAIAGWAGPGPFKIVNNYLEGATENVMFGGADPYINGVVPGDIEFRGNHLFKPASWKGVWRVKNLFEIKNAQRVLVEGNIMDGAWQDGQVGFGVVLKTVNQQNGCPWCVGQDVTLRYNIIRNVGAAFNIAASPDNSFPSIHARRFTINDNVVYNINTGVYLGQGRAFQLLDDVTDIVMFHNTIMSPTHSALNFGQGPTGVTKGTVYRDNVEFGGSFGLIGDNYAPGAGAFSFYAPGGTNLGNVMVLGSGLTASKFPTGNNYPTSSAAIGFANLAGNDFHLSSSSPYKGKATDGTDPGADINTVNSLTAKVIVP